MTWVYCVHATCDMQQYKDWFALVWQSCLLDINVGSCGIVQLITAESLQLQLFSENRENLRLS